MGEKIMDNSIIKDLLGDEILENQIINASSSEESQLIMLIVIRNNLNTIRDTLFSIKGWITFFGILAIIQIVISLFF